MVLSPVYIYDLACIFHVCVYVCVFMYSRTIAHVELMFLLIKPTLNKVYFTLLYFNIDRRHQYIHVINGGLEYLFVKRKGEN